MMKIFNCTVIIYIYIYIQKFFYIINLIVVELLQLLIDISIIF